MTKAKSSAGTAILVIEGNRMSVRHRAGEERRVERLSDENVAESLRRRQRCGTDGENDVVDQQRPVLQADRVVEADVTVDVLLLQQRLQRPSIGELEVAQV